MKNFLLIFTFFLAAFTANAQKLSFSAKGVKDTTVFMARYFGPKLYYADTAEIVNGKFSFDGSKHEGGLYAVVMPNGKYFEFVHDNEDITMQINDMNDFIGSMDVKKSVNNQVFYKYIQFMTASKKEGAEASKITEKEKRKAEIKKINDKVVAYQTNLYEKNKGRFVADMVKMSMEIELPDHPRDENGVITDSNYVYHYYIKHYWDNVNLKDPRIVRAPIFHNKLDKYFSQGGVLQIPDTINFYAKQLIDQTDDVDQNNKVFQYIVHHITNKYEKSKIMGMDRVFCYMASAYYCGPNNKAYWMTPENTKKVCERAEKVCRTSPGTASIPIILPDSTEKNWINSYSIDAEYTVLYFWDPTCGHCKKVTPKLQKLYTEKFKNRDVEVYAVAKATGEEFEKWKEYIRENKLSFINVGLTKTVYDEAMENPYNLLKEHTTLQSLNYADTWDIYSTPRIFILDKDKTILYKQLSISQLEEIIDKLTGHETDEKLYPIEEENEEEEDSHAPIDK